MVAMEFGDDTRNLREAIKLGIRDAERDPTVPFLVQVACRVAGQHFPMRIQIRQIGGRVGNSPDQAGEAFPLKPQLYFFRGAVEYPAAAWIFCFQFFQPRARIFFSSHAASTS